MANNIVNILTQAGSQVIAKSLAGQTVTFTSVSFGDDCYKGTTEIEYARANSVMKTGSGKGNITNGSITRKSTSGGTFTISVTFNNATFVGSQTYIKQIGIFAKTTTITTPVLFGYLSLGDYGTQIVKPQVQSMIRVFDIPFAFGQDSETLQIVPSGYVSAQDTATTATANKLIYANSNGKIPADITGSAQQFAGHDVTYFAIASHSHSDATTSASGFMAASDKSSLDTVKSRVNQALNTTSTPIFAGLTVNGVIRGATFE